jgi:surface polysaccharide O-acyltransferase-like enzyme
MSGIQPDICMNTTVVKTETASVSLSASRWVPNVERLRVLAILGIVWFHTEGLPGHRIAYAGLPALLLIFYSLIVRQGYAGTPEKFLKRRWRRLINPWIFWSLVYVVCHALKAVYAGDRIALNEVMTFRTFLMGAHLHLWYLPYAFVTGMILYLADRWIPATYQIAALWVSVWVGLLTLVAVQLHMYTQTVPAPLAQWEFSLATLPLGWAIGRCCRLPARGLQRMHLLAVGLMVSLSCIALNARGYGSVAIPYGLAVPAVCLAYAWPARRDFVTREAASLSYGIYLLHPLVIYVVARHLLPGGPFVAVMFLTLCLSGLLTWYIKRTPARGVV